MNNRLHESIGSIRRLNPIGSFCIAPMVLMALIVLGLSTTAEEPIWSLQDGKILKNDIVFVESGIGMPLGLIAGQNGSVIVTQPTELTQIFDENDDGKADFFRALIADLPVGQQIISTPMIGAGGELFVAVDRAGEAVDLISWKAGKTERVLSLPKTAQNLAIDSENVLAAIIADAKGGWIAMAQLPKPLPPKSEPAKPEKPEKPILRAVSVAKPVKPVVPELKPAVRIPKSLIGEGNTISGLDFAENAGFRITLSDGRELNVGAAPVSGQIQGCVIPAVADEKAFALQGVRLTTDGFEIVLNQPIDRGVGGVKPIPFQILAGKFDRKTPLQPIEIIEAVVEPDGRTLHLIPTMLISEQVYILNLSALKSETGEALVEEKAAYTVIEIPAMKVTPPLIEGDITDATGDAEDSSKKENKVLEEKG